MISEDAEKALSKIQKGFITRMLRKPASIFNLLKINNYKKLQQAQDKKFESFLTKDILLAKKIFLLLCK